MLISCRYCGRIHDTRVDCGKRPTRKRQVADAERGRYTSRWRRKSAQIKSDAGGVCEYCLAHGIVRYGALETHHIIPLIEQPDMLLDDENLIALCRVCHEQAEAGAISRDELRRIAAARISGSPRATDGVVFGGCATDRGPRKEKSSQNEKNRGR